MSGSLEEAYVAVERAYGQGDFSGALTLAEALLPQVPAGRPDLLDQRLQLLLGHIHLYGLNQPAQAATAYATVLEICAEPSYRELASQGLELSRQHMPPEPAAVAADPVPAAEPNPVPEARGADTGSGSAATTTATPQAQQQLPATPWLSQLQDPQLAMRQIQEAWATFTPAQAASGAAAGAVAAAATPGEAPATGATAPFAVANDAGGLEATAPAPDPQAPGEPSQPEDATGTAAADAIADIPQTEAVEEATDAAGEAAAEGGLVAPARAGAEASNGNDAAPGDNDPNAIIPVVVTVEEEAVSTPDADAADTADSTAAAAQAGEPPAETPAQAFTDEEWAELSRGLLLVELTTSNAGPTR